VLQPLLFGHRPDIRLIAADMDGTLLDDNDNLPENFVSLVLELRRQGIIFCPASGRQYYNLLDRFDELAWWAARLCVGTGICFVGKFFLS